MIKILKHILHIVAAFTKMRKRRVKKKRTEKGSKACAGNTRTPCEGIASPSTPRRIRAKGNRHA